MSDDLVKRLRAVEWSVNGEPCAEGNVDETCAKEAADRIEELEAALPEQIQWVRELADDLIAAEGREAKLKAKLAKAVRLIQFLDKEYQHVWGVTAKSEVRTTLAELKGETDPAAVAQIIEEAKKERG